MRIRAIIFDLDETLIVRGAASGNGGYGPAKWAREVLSYLERCGYHVAVLPWGTAAQEEVRLACVKSFSCVADIICGEPVRAPDRESAMGHFLELYGIMPNETVCVGHRSDRVIGIGHWLGAWTIQIAGKADARCHGDASRGSDQLIETIEELPAAIEDIERSQWRNTLEAPEQQVESSQQPQLLAEQLDLISTVSDKILSSPDLNEVLRSIVVGSAELLGATRGSIMTYDERANELRIEAATGIDPHIVQTTRVRPGEGISGYAAKTGRPLLIADIEKDDRFARKNREGYLTHSALCVPMKVKGRLIGVINMSDRLGGEPFTKQDLFLATVIANQAAIAIENARLFRHYVEGERIQRELEIACEIQQSFLPREVPLMPGFSLGGRSIPCESVGGDYYDFISCEDTRIVVAVADVSSHGIGPALLMSAVRACLRARTGEAKTPRELMSLLNRFVARDVPPDRFVTMLLGTVDVRSRQFVYASAGHDLPLLYRAVSGAFEELPSTGVPLGVLAEAEFALGPTITLEPGDILTLPTDGVWETGSDRGAPFGKRRLREIIRANRFEPATCIVDTVLRNVKDYTKGAPHDDITLVIIKAEYRAQDPGDNSPCTQTEYITLTSSA